VKFDDIERLVKLVAETGVAEVEVKQAGVQVRVSRTLVGESAGAAPQVHILPMGAPGVGSWPSGGEAAHAAVPAPAPAAPAVAPAADEEDDEDLHVVTASMVGTFYRRPNPEADPYASEGDVIKKGQVICILEAMKILNEIEAEISGTVVKVLAEDAQPVEYGEPLFAVRPV
jgi:acetyl-CoA carboxylase biotin carboxyl carrier protein